MRVVAAIALQSVGDANVDDLPYYQSVGFVSLPAGVSVTYRFVAPAGVPDEAVTTTLAGIADLERLERLHERAVQVKSWQELLATP